MDYKKYVYSFLITAVIFGTAILASDFFSQKRLNEIKNIESRIAVDILSSETQFSLLTELSCRDIDSSFLSRELSALGDRLSYTEEQRGADDPEVMNLKQYYSLLQIKDFLLMQRIRERCGNSPLAGVPSIIYFYSNERTGNQKKCEDCEREGLVLTRLRQEYPELRVYSFDYDLDLSAMQTLTSIYNIQDNLPALLINDKTYYGFKSVEDLKEIIPELKKIDATRAEAERTAEEKNSQRAATTSDR